MNRGSAEESSSIEYIPQGTDGEGNGFVNVYEDNVHIVPIVPKSEDTVAGTKETHTVLRTPVSSAVPPWSSSSLMFPTHPSNMDLSMGVPVSAQSSSTIPTSVITPLSPVAATVTSPDLQTTNSFGLGFWPQFNQMVPLPSHQYPPQFGSFPVHNQLAFHPFQSIYEPFQMVPNYSTPSSGLFMPPHGFCMGPPPIRSISSDHNHSAIDPVVRQKRKYTKRKHVEPSHPPPVSASTVPMKIKRRPGRPRKDGSDRLESVIPVKKEVDEEVSVLSTTVRDTSVIVNKWDSVKCLDDEEKGSHLGTKSISKSNMTKLRKARMTLPKNAFILRLSDFDNSEDGSHHIWRVDNHQLLSKYVLDRTESAGRYYRKTNRYSGWWCEEPWRYAMLSDLTVFEVTSRNSDNHVDEICLQFPCRETILQLLTVSCERAKQEEKRKMERNMSHSNKLSSSPLGMEKAEEVLIKEEMGENTTEQEMDHCESVPCTVADSGQVEEE